ncbi:MAG: CpaF family protein [Phycisphaerae bacterium]|nr:CpaF family protein [Phycisphaerae bacterium]
MDESTQLFDLPGVQPLRQLLLDPEITEIMINGPKQVFVERHGRMELAPVQFSNDQQIERLVDTLLEPTGRQVTKRVPFVDFRLPDGSRVNVIIPPVALDGPTVTIRKFTRSLSKITDLMEMGTLSQRMAYLLSAAIQARLNMVFAGATGAGKTTTLGILSAHIPESERIVTIEDTAELDLNQQHVVRLECRPPNIEGEGQITQEHLLRNALRMRPKRIILGEIRGDEAIDMIQAINSGHDGCLAVLHASTPADAVSRLEMMMLSRGLQLPAAAIRRQIASALDLIIQHEMLPDGTRKITHITELAGLKGDEVELRDLFLFQHEGPDETGRVPGRFVCTGTEPAFLPKFQRAGVELPPNLFARGEE